MQKESISEEISVLEDALKILVDELKEKGEDKLIKVNSDIGSINSSLRELDRISSLNKEEGIKLQKQRDEIAISKRNIESEKMRQENFDDNFLNQLNLQIDDLTLKHKLSRKKLSDAAASESFFLDSLCFKVRSSICKFN